MLVTANVLVRTVEVFSLDPDVNTVGTGFTAEGPNSNQYLITARHVLEDLKLSEGDHFKAWNAWADAVVEYAPLETPADTDVAVVRLDSDLTDRLPLPLTADKAEIGGPVRVVGYPMGLGTVIPGQGKIGFVRQGVLAGMETDPRKRWWFDMRSNPGFSGSPVVFEHQGKLRVMAVYQGALGSGDEDPLPGFVVGYDIGYAADVIDADSG